MQGAGWIAAGCVAVLVLTLLFGRVYCAMLCPLGVLMDFSAWLAKRTGKRRKLPYRRGRSIPRILTVSICAAGLLAGTALPLGFLDPYSVFGKITAATLRPLLGWINHLIAATSAHQSGGCLAGRLDIRRRGARAVRHGRGFRDLPRPLVVQHGLSGGSRAGILFETGLVPSANRGRSNASAVRCANASAHRSASISATTRSTTRAASCASTA